MKKTLVALVMAGGMVLGGTVVANAATTPSIKKPAASAAEGTGKHEMSETATKQKTEGVALIKKKSTKHLVKKSVKPAVKKKK